MSIIFFVFFFKEYEMEYIVGVPSFSDGNVVSGKRRKEGKKSNQESKGKAGFA